MTATLQPKKGGDAFCVGTYHMPCLFGSVDKERVMVIHASLAAARVKKVAAGKRYVLCGDFNVKPYDACYQLLTQGPCLGVCRSDADKPDGDIVAEKFSSTVEPPLKSAYVLANGKEPDFHELWRYKSPWATIWTPSSRRWTASSSGRAGP